MSNLDVFLAEGAYTCAGSVVYRNKEVGKLRDGDLHLNDDGRALLEKLNEVTDVVVKPAKGKGKAKAETVMEPEPADAPFAAELDALLGQ